MIPARMSRPVRVFLLSSASIAVAALATACGSQRISVPKSDPTYAGAVLFSQRCSGCHTLAFAGTHGSASNERTREPEQGPNFDVRCERPVSRVLYAIEDGGFEGSKMPQDVVVGQDAIEVAQFVSKYAGRKAALTPGTPTCDSKPIGTLPAPVAVAATAAGAPAKTTKTPAATGRGTHGAKTAPRRTGRGTHAKHPRPSAPASKPRAPAHP